MFTVPYFLWLFLACTVFGENEVSHLQQTAVGRPNDGTEQSLYRRLMTNYERDVRPTHDHRRATNVTIGFSLNQLVDVDEKNQVLTTRSWMNINWLDRRLSWNRSDYNGLDVVYTPHHRIWKPDIMLTNNADPNLRDAIMSTDIAIGYDGNVTWLFAAIYRSPCNIDVRYYPFDDQVCTLQFACWSHIIDEIDLRLTTDKGDLSNYLNNSEFHMLEMYAIRDVRPFPCCRDGAQWPVVTIVIHLRRRPLFYVFNHILPCVLICSMGLLGFYMPPDTGEKVTTCITTMLSMGVYLKTITEIIPPTSEAVPLIGVYYVVSLLIVCAATIMNAVTLNLYRKGYASQQDFASPWVKKWILCYMAKALCVRLPKNIKMYAALAKHGKHGDKNRLLQSFGHQDDMPQRKKNIDPAATEFIETNGNSRLCHGSDAINSVRPALFTKLDDIPDIPPMPINQRTDKMSTKRVQYRVNNGDKSAKRTVDQIPPPTSNVSAGLNIQMQRVSGELNDMLRQVTLTLQTHERRLQAQDLNERIQLEWQQLALVVDRALFWIFFTATLATIFSLLIYPACFQAKI